MRDADSARAEQRAAKDYREKQEKAQRARDLSTQAAINEKFAVRDYLASQPGNEYTEGEKETKKFWERFLNSDNFYSPYDDLLSSIQAKKEREQREKLAEESSTQAALDEKLAIRRRNEEQKNSVWGQNSQIEEKAREYSDGPAAFDSEGHINGQAHKSISSMRFGNSNVATSGCGAIAVYNVLQDMGKTQISLSDVIRTAERNGYMLAGGALGIMPWNMSKLMNDYGINHQSVDPRDIQQMADNNKLAEGTRFVVSVWNTHRSNLVGSIRNEVVGIADGTKPVKEFNASFLGMHNFEVVYDPVKGQENRPWIVYNRYSNRYEPRYYESLRDINETDTMDEYVVVYQIGR